MVALGIGLNVNSTPEALGVARPAWPLTTLRAEAGGVPRADTGGDCRCGGCVGAGITGRSL
jgi:hypothetical protein